MIKKKLRIINHTAKYIRTRYAPCICCKRTCKSTLYGGGFVYDLCMEVVNKYYESNYNYWYVPDILYVSKEKEN